MRILSKPLCLLSALCLTLAGLTATVLFLLTDQPLFERALQAHVPHQQMGIPPENLSAFASETMDYFTFRRDTWQPQVSTSSGLLPIAPSFTAHMDTVRQGIRAFFFAAVGLLAAGLMLLALCLFHSSLRFSRLFFLLGMLLPLLLAGLIFLFAAGDFSSLWYWLHVHFIPDGIFDGAEPIMRLFPLSLFRSYVPPLLIGILLCYLPLLLAAFLLPHLPKKRECA